MSVGVSIRLFNPLPLPLPPRGGEPFGIGWDVFVEFPQESVDIRSAFLLPFFLAKWAREPRMDAVFEYTLDQSERNW